MPVPALDNRPNLPPEHAELIDLYTLLSRSRPPAFASVPMAVPISEIRALYEMLRLQKYFSPAQFLEWMQELDGALIDHFREKHEKDEERRKAREKKR